MARHLIALLALLVLLGPALTRDEAEPLPAGTWKVLLPMIRGGGTRPLWLVKFEKKGDGWAGSVIATADKTPKMKADSVTLAKGRLRVALKSDELSLQGEFLVPESGKADKLLGTSPFGKGGVVPVELHRTALTSLDPLEVAKDELAGLPLGLDAMQSALMLLKNADGKKTKPADVRAWAEKASRSAELYGPPYQRDILAQVAGLLAEESGFEKIALQYAQRAERMLDPKDPPGTQKRILEVLAGVLEKAGKEDDAKDVLARIKKLDFRVKPVPFKGRAGKSDRVVLVELFTGAQCPPCVAADLGFDAVSKTYKPSEVVLLQYHTHIPRPDPLTNPDTEARLAFYDEAVKGTPTILFNGKPGAGGGGDADDAAEKYEDFQGVINPLLEKDSQGTIKLSATRKGDKIKITADVSGLAKTGDDIRLRLALTEDVVGYKGSNGLSRHHHVVRHMPGGQDGTTMKAKEGKFTFDVDIDDVKKKLEKYLKDFDAKRPFPDKERPMELKALKVVAFVQDDKTLEVFQAAQADIKAEE